MTSNAMSFLDSWLNNIDPSGDPNESASYPIKPDPRNFRHQVIPLIEAQNPIEDNLHVQYQSQSSVETVDGMPFQTVPRSCPILSKDQSHFYSDSRPSRFTRNPLNDDIDPWDSFSQRTDDDSGYFDHLDFYGDLEDMSGSTGLHTAGSMTWQYFRTTLNQAGVYDIKVLHPQYHWIKERFSATSLSNHVMKQPLATDILKSLQVIICRFRIEGWNEATLAAAYAKIIEATLNVVEHAMWQTMFKGKVLVVQETGEWNNTPHNISGHSLSAPKVDLCIAKPVPELCVEKMGPLLYSMGQLSPSDLPLPPSPPLSPRIDRAPDTAPYRIPPPLSVEAIQLILASPLTRSLCPINKTSGTLYGCHDSTSFEIKVAKGALSQVALNQIVNAGVYKVAQQAQLREGIVRLKQSESRLETARPEPYYIGVRISGTFWYIHLIYKQEHLFFYHLLSRGNIAKDPAGFLAALETIHEIGLIYLQEVAKDMQDLLEIAVNDPDRTDPYPGSTIPPGVQEKRFFRPDKKKSK